MRIFMIRLYINKRNGYLTDARDDMICTCTERLGNAYVKLSFSSLFGNGKLNESNYVFSWRRIIGGVIKIERMWHERLN